MPRGTDADGPNAGHVCSTERAGGAAIPAKSRCFDGQEPPVATPPPPETEERYYGSIRDYNESQGFGFIECDEAKMRYGMDVFIHRRQMFGLAKGDEVSFVIVRNSQGG